VLSEFLSLGGGAIYMTKKTSKVAILSLRPIETFCSLGVDTQGTGMKTSYVLEPFLKYEIVVCRFAVRAT